MQQTVQSPFNALVDDVQACSACSRMTHAHVLSAANGPVDAEVMFIAEAVGRRGGAVTGVPLTRDETGKRFNHLLAVAGIDRGRCFITNAVLCNPVDASGRNRTPLRSEVARCRPFLARTIDAVAAPVVVTLGRVALESLRAIEPHGIGLPDDTATPAPWRGRTLVAMYHPGRQAALHRSDELQRGDWLRLGAIVRSVRSL
jgi:DNA polymerase